jgi:hypothetical protein
MSDIFSLDFESVQLLFNEGEIEVPSKMNKEHGRTKKKIYGGKGLLSGRWESPLHERISGKKRPMLRRKV